MKKTNNIFAALQGDKAIWAIVALLALFSFLPVYSAASNLAYINGDGNTLKFLIKHVMHIMLGFGIMYAVHKVPSPLLQGFIGHFVPIVILLLIITLAQGTTMAGANAARWIKIPIIGVGFQTSALASVVLMVYVARYLARIKDKQVTFKETLMPLWLPVGIMLILILPANFSTTAIIFTMVIALVFLGGYPLKYIGIILVTGMVALTLFILVAKAFPSAFNNRVDTWTNRIEFFNDEIDEDADYQSERAKSAIATGGLLGLGPAKSPHRNLLPQASSDYIYPLIVAEYGMIGGMFLVLLYLLLLFRVTVIAHKAKDVFAKLLVIGVGMPVVFQAFVNMAVAVGIFPVTGQTLPLVSSGGTSIWMTCLALGIVLSVSAKHQIVKAKLEEELNPLDILSETL